MRKVKKKVISVILASAMFSSILAGCGNNIVDSVLAMHDSGEESWDDEDDEYAGDDMRDETKEGTEEDFGDEGETEIPYGEYVDDYALWDGTFDYEGVKVRIGMTLNEIAEQGYVIFPYDLPRTEDYSYVENVLSDMIVGPMLRSGDRDNIMANESFDIYKEEHGELVKVEDGDCFYYNPYPYAVSLGECIVGNIYFGTPDGYDEWNTNGDEILDIEEYKAATGTTPIELDTDWSAVPYEDFYIHIRNYPDGEILSVNAALYGLMKSYDDDMAPYEEAHGGAGFKALGEDLDPELKEYTFTTGYGTYTIDLSCYEEIGEFHRTYLEENDYTYRIILDGKLKGGDWYQATIECGCENYYLPIDDYCETAKYGYLTRHEGSNGEPTYDMGDGCSTLVKMFDGSFSVELLYDYSSTTVDEILKAQHMICDNITEVN